ncbi:hypothetical protein PHSC3_001270 [Chlamydiales bacterium STE3]|nr:hypothetical protein PHSC3_001270 [Chlamydiales bacterium STE3]
MKLKVHRKAELLSRILTNYSEETQAILKNDPKYFRRILKKRSKLIEILRSLESNS